MITVDDNKYGCSIWRHRKDHKTSDPILLKYFDGLSFHLYVKYRWYFNYLAALYQVETPRQFIEFSEFQYEYIPEAQRQIKKLKDKIKAAKAKITQNKNKLKRFESSWDQLFPYAEYPLYKKAVAKIHQKQFELLNLEAELKDLTTS